MQGKVITLDAKDNVSISILKTADSLGCPGVQSPPPTLKGIPPMKKLLATLSTIALTLVALVTVVAPASAALDDCTSGNHCGRSATEYSTISFGKLAST